jgi:hypothetical protein
MQQLGYLKIDGKEIKVMARLSKMRGGDGFYVSLKIRKTGELGKEMTDEALYLKNESEKLSDLLNGRVVKC